jgi:hypothetical protein
LVDQKAAAAVLINLKKEKDALEEKISAVNFNTKYEGNRGVRGGTPERGKRKTGGGPAGPEQG